jgi:hypothetical protein
VKKQPKPLTPPPLVAFLDANVLYSAPMRDFFLRLAVRFVFQPKWTDEIHAEWMEAVLTNRPDLTSAQLTRTRDLMNQHGNDWRVPVSYAHLIPTFSLPDLDDRHVLAAAIAAKAARHRAPEPVRLPGICALGLWHPGGTPGRLRD